MSSFMGALGRKHGTVQVFRKIVVCTILLQGNNNAAVKAGKREMKPARPMQRKSIDKSSFNRD